MIHRSLVGVLLLLLTALGAEEIAWESRLQPEEQALDTLLRDERWSLIQAQEAYGRKQWKPAAALYQKFTITFPDSAMWNYAGYRMAECLLRDEQMESAIKAATEVAEADPKAPEVPEALLIIARAHRLAGRIDASLLVARRILSEHPASAAATPARLEADQCLMLNAKRAGQRATPAEVAQSRLALLGPATDPLDLRPLNERATGEVLDRLVEVALEQGNRPRIAALITALTEPSLRPNGQRLGQVRARAAERGLDSALWADDDAGLAVVASATWADAGQRALGLGRVVVAWSETARGRLGDWAKELGREPAAVEARITARLAAVEADLAPRWQQLPERDRSEGMWTVVRGRLASRQPASALQLLVSAGQPPDRGAASRYFETAIRTGNPVAAAREVLGHVPEGLERRKAMMDVARWEAFNSKGAEAKTAALQAVALAQELEASDADQGHHYLGVQAEVQRHVLRDFDAAIVAYGKLNRPPDTDMAMAECLNDKGEHAKAMAKYLEIHALYAQTGSGPQALLRAGLLAHKPLDQKARAISLLRRVCDDYSNHDEYNHAHRYLQAELGVTYTGGGGARKK